MKITGTLAFLCLLAACCSNKAKEQNRYEQYAVKKRPDTTTIYATSTFLLKSGTIPDSVFQMDQLRVLSITGMDCDYREHDENGKDITQCWSVHEISPKIGNLVNLETLWLPQNNIAELPETMNQLQRLKIIDLTDNTTLRKIDVLTQLPALEELYLYGCQLTRLPENIGALRNLKRLGLNGNYLSDEEKERITKALPGCAFVFSQ